MAAALVLVASLTAAPIAAQPVLLAGKLQIGFSDDTNVTGFRANYAVPICAGAGPSVNPGTIGTTLGTLPFFALANAEPGPGGAITFHAVGGGFGGAREHDIGTCNVAIPPFANPRLRSRTQIGSAHFPGRKGKWTSMITSAPVPATPTATYRLSAGGGHTAPVSVTSWTTRDENDPNAAPPFTITRMHTGSAFEAPMAWYGPTTGGFRFQPGALRFGGGVPWSGRSGVQIGVNFPDYSNPFGPTDFGQVSYVNGFLPAGPQFFGTDHKGVDARITTTPPTYPTYTKGLFFTRRSATYAARTPGGTTRYQSGAIYTVNGGNTRTPRTPSMPGAPVVSPIQYVGYNFEWTTGAVTHTNQIGDFMTVRRAQGFDVAVAASTAVAGETRRLQVVTPWAAAIQPIGSFGVPVPTTGFGGVAILTLEVIPAPSPSAGLATALGGLALGLAARRRG